MKLHLPTGLRKALLACLATLAGRRALRRTVASGTALLGAFSLLWSTATFAQADEVPPLAAPAGDELALGTESEDEEEHAPLAANSEEDVMLLAATNGVMPIASGDLALTWTQQGDFTLSSSARSSDGWSGDADSLAEYQVVLAGSAGQDKDAVNVAVSGSLPDGTVSMQELMVGAAGGADTTNYNFTGQGNTTNILAIAEELTLRAGTVTFGNYVTVKTKLVDIQKGVLQFTGSGLLELTGNLLEQGDAISGEGGISIARGATLRVGADNTNINGNAFVHGQGTVELELSSDKTLSADTDNWFTRLFPTVTYQEGIQKVKLTGTHKLTLSDVSYATRINNNIHELEVDSGSTLVLGYSTTGETGSLSNTVLVVNGNLYFTGAADVADATYVVRGLTGGNGDSVIKLDEGGGDMAKLVIDYSGDDDEEMPSFAGQFSDQVGNAGKKVDLVKRGTGTQILTTSHLDTRSTTVEGGTLKFEADYGETWSNFAVNTNAHAQFDHDWDFRHSLTVNGGNVTISGSMGLYDPTDGTTLTINHGGSLTVATLQGVKNAQNSNRGHAGRILVGEGSDSIGTLTVGSEASLGEAGEVLKTRGLKVQGKGESTQSTVTVYGDVNVYGVYDDGCALIVDAGLLDIKKNLHGDGVNSGRDNNPNLSNKVKVTGGGTLQVGTNAWVGSLEISGANSSMTVQSRLSLNDDQGGNLSITDGGNLTVGYIRGQGNNAHAGVLKIGDEDSIGNLTITGEGLASGDALMARGLLVQASTEGEGPGSVVNITGDANLYGVTVGGGANALEICGKGSSVTISGNLHGLNSNGTENVVVRNGGTLTVMGSCKIQDDNQLEITDGTVILKGGLEAGSVTLTQGSLTLGGEVNVSTGFTVSGGTLELGSVADHDFSFTNTGLKIQLTGGTLDLSAANESDLTNINLENLFSVDVSSYLTGGGHTLLNLSTTTLSSLVGELELIGWDGTGLQLVSSELAAKLLAENQSLWNAFAAHLRPLSRTQHYELSAQGVLTIQGTITELTWNGSSDSNTWQAQTGGEDTMWNMSGSEGGTYFSNGDAVTFTTTGEYSSVDTDVSIIGTVEPGNIAFESGDWTFSGEGSSVHTVGRLRVAAGATATFSELTSFKVGEAEVSGNLKLNFTGAKSLGTATINGTLTITDGTASNWKDTTLSGDGTVVLDANGTVTVDQNANLFANLFAAGDTAIQRDDSHAGIGRFKIARGTTLALNNNDVGKGLSLIQKLTVKDGATLQLGANVFDNSSLQGNYSKVGTIELEGSGTTDGHGALTSGTTAVWVKWNVSLTGDATLYTEVTGNNYFSFDGGAGGDNTPGKLSLNRHTLTFAAGANNVNFRFYAGYEMAEGEAGSGIFLLNRGAKLFMNTDAGDTFANVEMQLQEGSTLQMEKNATFQTLSGAGGVSFGGGITMTLAGEGTKAYTGTIAPTHNGTIVVSTGATFLLGDRANVGNTLNVLGTLSTTGTVTAYILNIDGSGEVTLGETSVLTVTNTLGGMQNQFGSITGSGLLKLTGNGGSFAGAIETNFEYAGNGTAFSYTGAFSGTTLTVTSGSLTLGNGFSFGRASDITVSTSGTLTLDYENGQTGGLLTMNGGTLSVGTTATDGYTFAGLSGSNGSFNGDGKLVLDVGSEEQQTFSGVVNNQSMSMVKKGEGTQEFTTTERTLLKSLDLQAGELSFTHELYVGGDGTDLTVTGLTVTGGTLQAGLLTVTRNIGVAGEGATLTVTGNATLNNYAKLTVADGANVTIEGYLCGNKKGTEAPGVGEVCGSGQITVGEHNETSSSVGTLTLGKSDVSDVTHRASGVTVIGTSGEGKSTLTVYGDLSVYGYTGSSGELLNDGMQVGWGATGTINGALTVGVGFESGLAIGGSEAGNTGTLTVSGLLTAHHLALAGSGSKLTANGGLTVTGDATVTEGTLELGGTVSTGSLTVGNGTVKALSGMTATRGQTWTLGVGGVLEVGGGEIQLSGEEGKWTLQIHGGELKLTDGALTSLKDITDLELSLTGLTSYSDWDYKLFDTTADGWNKEEALEFLKARLASDYTEGRRELTVDEDGVVHFVSRVETLTWSSGVTTWQNELQDDHWLDPYGNESSFVAGDSIIFTDATDENHSIAISGEVRPHDIEVRDGKWQFTGEQGSSLTATGTFTVQDDASVTFESAGDIALNGGKITGKLTLGGEGTKNLGNMIVAENGTISVSDTTASHWTGTTLSGDGTVVLDADTVTVNGNNNLFAALFAAGDTNLQRDNTHEGIGRLEVASDSTLILAANATNIGKGMSFLRELKIASGATLKTTVSQVFDYQGYYTQHGKLILEGHGNDENTGALHVTAQDWMKWDVELANDATIYVENVTLHFAGRGGYAGSFDGHGHKLVIKGSGNAILKIDENFQMIGNEGGEIEMSQGTTLQLSTATALDMHSYGIVLNGGTLSIMQSATIKSLTATGSSTVNYNGGHVLTVLGNVNASGMALTLNGSSQFIIQGTGTNTLGSITLNGNARMQLDVREAGVGVEDPAALTLGGITNNGHTLTLTLTGVEEWVQEHLSDVTTGDDGSQSWKLHLFGGAAATTLASLYSNSNLTFDFIIGYTPSLDASGILTLTKLNDVVWTGSLHEESDLTWAAESSSGSIVWDSEATFTNGAATTFNSDEEEDATIKVSGAVQSSELITMGGTVNFLAAEGSGNGLTVVTMDLQAMESNFGLEVTLKDWLTLETGKTATFTGSLKVINEDKVTITLEEGSTLTLRGRNDLLSVGTNARAEMVGTGAFVVDLSEGSGTTFDGANLEVAEGIKMSIMGTTTTGDSWNKVQNLNALGNVEMVGKQILLESTNTIGNIVMGSGETPTDTGCALRLVNNGATTTITGEGDTNLEDACLEVRNGSFEKQHGKLTVGGLRSHNGTGSSNIMVEDLEIVADDTWTFNSNADVWTKQQRAYRGTLTVGGNLTMNERSDEEHKQYIAGNISVGGDVDVLGGLLHVGGTDNGTLSSPPSTSMNVGGSLKAQGGSFVWEGEGELSLGGLSTAGEGHVHLTAGSAAVSGTLSGGGGVISVGEGVTLKSMGGGEYGGRLELSGGTLVVEGDTPLIVTNVTNGESRIAANLQLGEGAHLRIAGGELTSSLSVGSNAQLTLVGGKLTLTGEVNWDSNARLTLDVAEGADPAHLAHLALGGGFGTAAGSAPITLNLTSDYLDALTGGSGETSVDFFNVEGSSWQSEWVKYFDVVVQGASWRYTDLHLDEEGRLVWDGQTGVKWDGNSGGTWNDDDQKEWESVEGEGPVAPGGKDVHFTEEGADPKGSQVQVQGPVTPNNVFVEGGQYSFEGNDAGGGLDIQGEGLLVVEEGAELDLNLKNTSIPKAIVEGTLGLGHDEALPEGTQLELREGSALRYVKEGARQDVSGLVTEDSVGNVLQVEVDEKVGEGGVTWGNESTHVSDNNGLEMALDTGTTKTGTGDFTLSWMEQIGEIEHAGHMKVEGGTLTLDAHGGNDSSTSKLTGGAEVSKHAELKLKSTTGSLEVSGVTGQGVLSVESGNVVLSGQNDVSDIELASGSHVTIGSDDGLGDGNTTLTLAGASLTSSSDDGNTVKAGTVLVDGETTLSGTVTLTGTLQSGETAENGGTLTLEALGEGSQGTLTGDIYNFTGTLNTGESGNSTWTLSGEAASGIVQANVSGSGTLEVDAKDQVTLTGSLGNKGEALTVKATGTGDVVIAGELGSGVTLDTSDSSKGAIVLGGVLGGGKGHIDLTGYTKDVDGTGTIVLSNVTLGEGFEEKLNDNAGLYVSTALASGASQTARAYSLQATPREAAPQGGVVDVNGMAASNLDGITINEHGQLTGVTGTYTVDESHGLELHFSAENAEGTALIEWKEKKGDSKVKRGSNTQLAFSEDIFDLFDENEGTVTLTALANGSWDEKSWNRNDNPDNGNPLAGMDDTVAQILSTIISSFSYTEDGISMTGTTQDLYLVNGKEGGDSPVSDKVTDLLDKRATVLLHGQTLTLNWDGSDSSAKDAKVNNLLGTEGTELAINNTAKEDAIGKNRLNVKLDNTYHENVNMNGHEGETLPEPDDTTVRGQDTSFKGKITGGPGVDITKTGKGTLTVGDNYQLTDGTTSIQQGALVLRGANNSMQNLEFAYEGAVEGVEQRGLKLQNGKTTIKGQIQEKEGSYTEDNKIEITEGAELVLEGKNTLASTQFTGDGTGTVTLEDSASLTLTGGGEEEKPQLDGVGVNMDGEDTVLDVGAGNSSLSALNGNGTLKSAKGGKLTVSGGTFSGTLASSGNQPSDTAGTLVVEGGTFTLDNVTTESGSNWGLTVNDGAQLNLNLIPEKTSEGSEEKAPPAFGDVTVNGKLRMDVDTSKTGSEAPVSGKLTVGESGSLEVHGDGKRVQSFTLGFTTEQSQETLKDKVTLSGSAFVFDDLSDVTVDEKGNITVTTKKAEDNKFERVMPNAGKNGLAGAEMLWDFLKDKTQWGAFMDVLNNPNSDYAKLGMAVIGMMDGKDAAGMERTLTAVAGASISTLTPALAEDLHRQLNTMRNRTTTVNSEARYDQYDVFPTWHAWINAEGGYHKLDADGYLPGYTLNNWGGSLGVGADLSDRTSVGVALTAMYGRLRPDAADSATGHLDTMYLSAFMRTMQGPWMHTFVVSGGLADVRLNRTVNYGSGSYRTKGSTNGYAFGALYELGYTKLMNERGTAALQPIVNVEFRHVGIKGYTETGSDAGLKVDDMRQSVLTFGMGARFQCVVSENAFKRDSIFEARLLLKADAGDRSGKATNGIIGSRTMAKVESAEVGAVGIEAGAGLTIPLGSGNGSIFMDASIEYRRGWTSVNASAGYKITF